MNERDVIEHVGQCSTCREIVTSPEPIPVPAPCKRCGGIAFETDRAEPN